ncbi:hypothetical protein TH19_03805 [Thalassospira profundimaris]|uniref:HTH tetR-type domain-containing protein n=2 Tax=Thalassospira TaxID=168934 RepID=A0A367WCE6_9PROT|nr:hypothetical protein TH19_03805 [Thalassospira profundimaris]
MVFVEMSKRKYTKGLRADQQHQTHLKIVEAAIALHAEVGPLQTTISAIADRAGVQRLTIYRHFPEEHELLDVSLARWFDLNPPPDPQEWRASVAPVDWGIAILSMLYQYYSETAQMWAQYDRDRGCIAVLDGKMAKFDGYLEMLAIDVLVHQPGARQKAKLCQAVARHALQFSTWQSLSQTGLDTVEMAALMDDWLHKCPLS